MVDVRGDVLRPPNYTTQAAVNASKNQENANMERRPSSRWAEPTIVNVKHNRASRTNKDTSDKLP